MFKNLKPIKGIAYKALKYCLENLGKKNTSFKNRL